MIDECLTADVRVEGDGCPLAEAARSAGAPIDARPPLLRDDGNTLLRFGTAGAGGIADVLDADDRIRYLHASRSDGRHDFRCLSTQPCVIHELISAGFLADSLRYSGGIGRFTGAVVGHDVLQGVMTAAGETVGVRLERVSPLVDEGEGVARPWDLTPRQEAALRTALEMGYFSIPKAATAAGVADELGIGKSAFLERLRRGQSSLIGAALGRPSTST